MLAALLWAGVDVSAQSAAEPEKPTSIADAANRIAKSLWPVRADPVVQPNMPVFRSGVTVDDWPPLPVPWHLTERPAPSNRRFNGYHHEHLMITTPEAFRTSTFYPIGAGVDPALVAGTAKKVWRDWQTARIRRRIAAELAALERASQAAAENADR